LYASGLKDVNTNTCSAVMPCTMTSDNCKKRKATQNPTPLLKDGGQQAI